MFESLTSFVLRKTSVVTILVYLFAFAVRVVPLALIHNPVVNDSLHYEVPARMAAAGQGWSMSRQAFLERGKPEAASRMDREVEPALERELGYIAFLTFCYTISDSNEFARWLQILLSALIPVLLFRLLLRRGLPLAALLTGVLLAFDPVSGSLPHFILRECFLSFLIVLFAVSCSIERFRTTLTGLFLGTMGATFSLLAPFPAALWAVDFWFNKTRVRYVTIWSLIVAMAVIGAGIARNKMVSDDDVALRGRPIAILIYMTTAFDYDWLPDPADPQYYDLTTGIKKGRTWDQIPDSEIWPLVWEKIQSEPLAVAKRYLKANFWYWVEVPGAMKLLKDHSVLHGLMLIHHNLQLLIFLIGAGWLARNRQLDFFRLPFWMIVLFAVLSSPFMPIPRYYAPFMPLILMVGAAGIERMWNRQRATVDV